MAKKHRTYQRSRRGAVVVLVASMMIVLVAMVAFAVDYGCLLKVRTDMQRAADAAALAAVQSLTPAPNGTQDLETVRDVLRDYVTTNIRDASFLVPERDIQIGRYEPSTIYSEVTLLDSGLFDAVRVTLRRDGAVNPRAPLFFGRALGIRDASVTVSATAVLQKPGILLPGANILPFAVPLRIWENHGPGDVWSIYGDGRIENSDGNQIPGNWGTVDIGAENNSTSELADQIQNGLRQSDLDALYYDGRIPDKAHIAADEKMWVNADTGISSGMKDAVRAVHGDQRLIPIYDQLGGSLNGNNAQFQLVGWGVVTVVDSKWHGGNHTYIRVQRSYMYDGALRAKTNNLEAPAIIEGAYSSPVLVE